MDAALAGNQQFPASGRFLAAAGLAAIGAASAAVWYFDPTKESFFPVCPLYKLTGFACPGCGLTRAFHALFHGDILTALDFNALVPVVALLLLFAVASLMSVVVRGRGLARLTSFPPFLIGLLVLLVTFGILRNLPYYPFNWLFP